MTQNNNFTAQDEGHDGTGAVGGAPEGGLVTRTKLIEDCVEEFTREHPEWAAAQPPCAARSGVEVVAGERYVVLRDAAGDGIAAISFTDLGLVDKYKSPGDFFCEAARQLFEDDPEALAVELHNQRQTVEGEMDLEQTLDLLGMTRDDYVAAQRRIDDVSDLLEQRATLLYCDWCGMDDEERARFFQELRR